VISNAAVGVPNVKALVYIAGFAPDTGESLVQLVTMNPGTQIGPATLDTRPYPLPDGGTGDAAIHVTTGARDCLRSQSVARRNDVAA
jgi:hypothetical protein